VERRLSRLRYSERWTENSCLSRCLTLGEVVFATVSQITPYGAYVTLDEYSNHKGFLHISEVSTGWVRNIERFVKPGQKVVLKVVRVDEERREVDLSLRQVTSEEKKEKLIQVKKEAKAKGILELVKKSLGIQDDSAIRQAARR